MWGSVAHFGSKGDSLWGEFLGEVTASKIDEGNDEATGDSEKDLKYVSSPLCGIAWGRAFGEPDQQTSIYHPVQAAGSIVAL